MALTIKQVKDALGTTSATVGKNKLGQIVVRRGFFYRHGKTSQDWVNTVSNALTAAKVEFNVVSAGEVWKAFRGGSTVANSSHWYVVLS